MKKPMMILIGVIVLALIVGGIYFFTTYTPSGDTTNGYWNSATQECWISENQPPGESYPTGDESMFVSCCFNQEGDQVDCNDPTNILGSGVVQAIYGAGEEEGIPGIFGVSHTITLSNEGSVPIDNIWIDSAVWSPTHTELTNAYNQVIGSASAYAGDLPVGNSRNFPTGFIDLTEIQGAVGTPITYDLTLTAIASAYEGQLTSSKKLLGLVL